MVLEEKNRYFHFYFNWNFFGINTLINIHIDDDIFTKYEIISLILVFMGYICLFILNFRKNGFLYNCCYVINIFKYI